MRKFWAYCFFIITIFLFILSLITPVPFDEILTFLVAIIAFLYIFKDILGEIDKWLSSDTSDTS